MSSGTLCAAPDRPGGLWDPDKGLLIYGKVVPMDGNTPRWGWVFVQGDTIVGVGTASQSKPAAAADAFVVYSRGVILPGLIDAHNHIEFNHLPLWDVPDLYEEMYDWMSGTPAVMTAQSPPQSPDAGDVIAISFHYKGKDYFEVEFEGNETSAWRIARRINEQVEGGKAEVVDGRLVLRSENRGTPPGKSYARGGRVEVIEEFSTLGGLEATGLQPGVAEGKTSRLYKRDIRYPKKLLSVSEGMGGYMGMKNQICKYSEAKALVGGTTTIQGSPITGGGFSKMMVRNIEHWKPHGKRTLGQKSVGIMGDDFQESGAMALAAKFEEEKLDGWLVHLAEGSNAESRHEFEVLKQLGLNVKQTIIIHGTSLEPEDFAEMAAVGDSPIDRPKIVASPLDNYLLYAGTLDIPAALDAGLLVSIGADWSPFGAKNLLTELKVLDQLNQREWDSALSDETMVAMVTRNPADTIGWQDFVGRIRPGMKADLLVIDKVDNDPYRALIDATEHNVQLVLVGGEPLYGDTKWMNPLKGEDLEIVYRRAGREKAIDVTQDGPKDGLETFAELQESLATALQFDPDYIHENAFPSISELSDEEWEQHIEDKFEYGWPEAVPLDPLFPDEDYFERLRNNRNPQFEFDIMDYWNADQLTDDPIEGDANGFGEYLDGSNN